MYKEGRTPLHTFRADIDYCHAEALTKVCLLYTSTRRLVDVSHDVLINEEDCGTLRGLVCTDLKNNDEIIATLYERILGLSLIHI